MNNQRKTQARRGFLKGMLLGSGAAAVAIASGGAVAAPKAEGSAAAKPKAQSQGYRETAHVRSYYQTAQF